MEITSDIKGFITSIPEWERGTLRNQLELMLCVLANYNHAQDMEMLVRLYENFRSEYYDQYHPHLADVYRVCAKIARTTHNGIYEMKLYTKSENQDKTFHALSVASHFPEIISSNKHYQKLIEGKRYASLVD